MPTKAACRVLVYVMYWSYYHYHHHRPSCIILWNSICHCPFLWCFLVDVAIALFSFDYLLRNSTFTLRYSNRMLCTWLRVAFRQQITFVIYFTKYGQVVSIYYRNNGGKKSRRKLGRANRVGRSRGLTRFLSRKPIARCTASGDVTCGASNVKGWTKCYSLT